MRALPRLILVHGTRFDSSQWAGYTELCPGIDVSRVDLPGHGTRVGEPWSIEVAAHLIGSEVDAARRAGAPVVVAGHSLGGYVAAHYAAAHPDALAGLVLIGATADPSRHPLLSAVYAGFAAAIPRVGPERMARGANQVMRLLGARDALPGPAGYAVTQDAWASIMATGRADNLRGVTCPVFLMAGQFDQMRLDLGAYADACPQAWVRIVPRATHLMPLTHRAAVATALTQAVELATAPDSRRA